MQALISTGREEEVTTAALRLPRPVGEQTAGLRRLMHGVEGGGRKAVGCEEW
jgi:hypothetical protein